jgi:hypothetical protein
MASQDLPLPELSRNMRLIGHTDQGGRPDGVQLMVHRGYAYVGHMFSAPTKIITVAR